MRTRPAEVEKQRQAAVVREHFDGASAAWTSRYAREPRSMADLDLILRRQNVHALVKPLLDGVGRRLRVLDIGCGSGDVLDGLPRDVISVAGMDFSAEMVRQARATHAGDSFVRGDATRLPFRYDAADIITTLGVLEYVPRPSDAVARMAESLAPGGHLIVSFPNRASVFRLMLRVERWMERSLVRVRDLLRGTSKAEEYDRQYRHRQWKLREAIAMLERAGLVVEEIRVSTFGPWGRLGRIGLMRSLARGVSRRWTNAGFVSSRLACTFVVCARKPDDA